MAGIALVWFRNDLRLRDHPALQVALQAGLTPLPVYIHSPHEEGEWAPGAASDAWRHKGLAMLDADLRALGSRLHLFNGDSAATLHAVARHVGAEAVFWNHRYEPAIDARDDHIRRELLASGLRAEARNGSLLFEPWQLATRQGDPFRVFTPFWKAALAAWRLQPLIPAPDQLPHFDEVPGEVALDDLGLQPALRWDASFWDSWIPGEAGAEAELQAFVENRLHAYPQGRDLPAEPFTSRLSPYLHFGHITPWRVIHALGGQASTQRESFVRELGWRDFAYHVMHHYPDTPQVNFNRRFDDLDWREPEAGELEAWQQGRTGVPIIDAGMRQLWSTGWMHNRVRMIVASFLTKNLRLHWLHGAHWFWDTLVDADLANNTLGWQWSAGTGVDAAPYFRVFNPVLQARRFDPEGEYIACWVPELRALPPSLRHAPWEALPIERMAIGDYPARPMVDLADSRRAALDAFAQLKARRGVD